MDSLMDKIEFLLKKDIGDNIRLEHIKQAVADNRRLYDSDRDYVENLTKRYFVKPSDDYPMEQAKIKCWACGQIITNNSNYCSFCGVKHYQQEEARFIRKTKRFLPIQFLVRLQFYQILAVIGGLSGLIPVLYALSRMDNVLYLVEYYAGQDISGWTNTLVAGGIVSSILSCVAIAIPFVIKRPTTAGRVLFFTSFGVLITSILVGSIGFVLTLVAGLIALKSRRY